MKSISRKSWLFFLLLFAALGAASAETEGWYGIEVEADGKGRFWNPVVNTVTIKGIAPGSPAADSRIAVGDMIIEVEGLTVAGQRAGKLSPHFEKPPGSELHLGLLTLEGEEYEVVLISAERPADD